MIVTHIPLPAPPPPESKKARRHNVDAILVAGSSCSLATNRLPPFPLLTQTGEGDISRLSRSSYARVVKWALEPHLLSRCIPGRRPHKRTMANFLRADTEEELFVDTRDSAEVRKDKEEAAERRRQAAIAAQERPKHHPPAPAPVHTHPTSFDTSFTAHQPAPTATGHTSPREERQLSPSLGGSLWGDVSTVNKDGVPGGNSKGTRDTLV